MQRVETFVEVRGSVSAVYEQWKRFENVPCVPENDGPRRVSCSNDEVLAAVPESNAPIVQFEPPQRIVASHSQGAYSRRVVSFHPVGNDSTRVTLSLEYEADSNVEDVGKFLVASIRGIQADLKRFRGFLRTGRGRKAMAAPVTPRPSRPAILH